MTKSSTLALHVAILLLIAGGASVTQAAERSAYGHTAGETGVASYYAKRFEGRRTASGHTFRNSEMMAAHHSHPFGTIVRVTNLERGNSVDVRITDRGAFGKTRRSSTIIDLSQAAAARLDMITGGRARVLVEVIEWGGRKGQAMADAVHRNDPVLKADAISKVDSSQKADAASRAEVMHTAIAAE